ncbi:MAG: type II toxin-antitoxin system RelE family toxin [Solirubrobacteraceae bacterium]
MTHVALSAIAVEDLDRLIITHSLPSDTRQRVIRSLRVLEDFPRVGRQLTGRWQQMRFILGPWRWLLVVYLYEETRERVLVVTIQDPRSAAAATSGR